MTKSTITRERLAKIKSWREIYGAGSNVMLPAEEAEALALIALAAMDSEPVALQPELAKVIYHFRDWNKGFPVERFKADYVISWMLVNYPPAQPAPVVPQDVLEALQKVARIRLDMNDFDGDRRGIADCLGDAEEALIEVVNRRAAVLQAEPVCTCPSGNGSLRWPCPVHAGSSPVIPDGYVLVPMRLTAENGAKGALSGEFSETKFVNCPECFGDDECETCDGSGRIEITVPVTWTTIKAIWVKGVEHFAATAQENN
ncbi:TPA: hypothetical protein JHJ56_003166 [Raoultella ornithinolytica]|nr:hypothetical protein [Raoultella ornithinolytica]HAV2052314.1 hypothetical protein [Raoultella ornithinolytica]